MLVLGWCSCRHYYRKNAYGDKLWSLTPARINRFCDTNSLCWEIYGCASGASVAAHILPQSPLNQEIERYWNAMFNPLSILLFLRLALAALIRTEPPVHQPHFGVTTANPS